MKVRNKGDLLNWNETANIVNQMNEKQISQIGLKILYYKEQSNQVTRK